MTDAKVDQKKPSGGALDAATATAGDEADGGELEEALFDAPERGSADELLDAGAHSDLDAMRHSTAHVMAEAVLDLFPGTQLGIGPAITDGFYYDFKLDRPLTPGDLATIEERMAASVAADQPFVRRELPPEEGRAFFAERDQPFKVEILDDLAAKAKADGSPMPPTTIYRHGSFERPVQGPARREHRRRSGRSSCLADLRRVLARRREAAGPPADLRHGLADPGGARRVPLAPRRGEEARPSPARRPARPVQLPRRQPGLGLLAPQGPADLADARRRDARAPGPARLPGDQHADPRATRSSGSSRATGSCTTRTCSWLDVGGPRRSRSSR